MPTRILVAITSCLLLVATIQGDEKPDPQIQAVVDYFAKNGFKMEKAEAWGWQVTDPKFAGYYIVVNFKTFPTEMTEKEMKRVLSETNLAHMLNTPSRLAMSYPGLRGDAPGEPKHPVPDLKKLKMYDKMIKLFMDYRPGEVKKK